MSLKREAKDVQQSRQHTDRQMSESEQHVCSRLLSTYVVVLYANSCQATD